MLSISAITGVLYNLSFPSKKILEVKYRYPKSSKKTSQIKASVLLQDHKYKDIEPALKLEKGSWVTNYYFLDTDTKKFRTIIKAEGKKNFHYFA